MSTVKGPLLRQILTVAHIVLDPSTSSALMLHEACHSATTIPKAAARALLAGPARAARL